MCGVEELVPRPLVLGILGLDEIRLLDAVAVYDREAIDVGLFSDGACFCGTDASLGADCCEMERREQSNPASKGSSCYGFHDSGPFICGIGLRSRRSAFESVYCVLDGRRSYAPIRRDIVPGSVRDV